MCQSPDPVHGPVERPDCRGDLIQRDSSYVLGGKGASEFDFKFPANLADIIWRRGKPDLGHPGEDLTKQGVYIFLANLEHHTTPPSLLALTCS